MICQNNRQPLKFSVISNLKNTVNDGRYSVIMTCDCDSHFWGLNPFGHYIKLHHSIHGYSFFQFGNGLLELLVAVNKQPVVVKSWVLTVSRFYF